jgi:hypothetical protein
MRYLNHYFMKIEKHFEREDKLNKIRGFTLPFGKGRGIGQ